MGSRTSKSPGAYQQWKEGNIKMKRKETVRNKKQFRQFAFIFALWLLWALVAQGIEPKIGQHAYVFEYKLKAQQTEVRMNYLLFLPKSYGLDLKQKWPLIFFLHGGGEMGDNVELLKVHSIPKIVEKKDDFPFVCLSPQIPNAGWVWSENSLVEVLCALLDEIVATYAIDANRIYVTGLSFGGFNTWLVAISHPEHFAAIAPICGISHPERYYPERLISPRSFTEMACALKNVPTWVFHGAKDPIVPLSESEEMVEALKACGGNVRFTVYPDAGHDAWTATYDNPELYDWFLQHSFQPAVTNVKPNGKLSTTWGEVKRNK